MGGETPNEKKHGLLQDGCSQREQEASEHVRDRSKLNHLQDEEGVGAEEKRHKVTKQEPRCDTCRLLHAARLVHEACCTMNAFQTKCVPEKASRETKTSEEYGRILVKSSEVPEFPMPRPSLPSSSSLTGRVIVDDLVACTHDYALQDEIVDLAWRRECEDLVSHIPGPTLPTRSNQTRIGTSKRQLLV